MEQDKEKGAYFGGSSKKYPDIALPKWMQEREEELDL